jgi:hypothetical protein
MKHFLTKIDKSLISSAILAHIPKKKRGFSSRFSMEEVLDSIIYKKRQGVSGLVYL